MQLQGLSKVPLKAWNQLIQASTRNGSFSETLHLYSSMQRAGVHGDRLTLPSVAKSCAKLGLLNDGRQLHAHAILVGLHADVFVQTSLLDTYAKCSDLVASRQVFDEMPVRNLVSWNSMMAAYSGELQIDEAVRLFNGMRDAGFKPGSRTCLSLVSGCIGSDSALWQGLSVHGYTIKSALDLDLVLANSFLNMYIKFGLIGDARLLFDSVSQMSTVTWTSMMGGYVSIGDFSEVFSLFDQMQRDHSDFHLDSIAILNLVSACALVRRLPLSCSVHAFLIKRSFDYEGIISASLVNLYAHCDDLASARKVFDSVDNKDVSLWTSMIGGYVRGGHLTEALSLFQGLVSTTVKPNRATLVTVLSACANLGSLSIGEKVEECIKANGLDPDLQIRTALIRMYSKCGCIEKAKHIFDGVSAKDITIWSTMINGYACHGKGREALALFKELQSDERIKPDAIMFTDVLSACSHSGLVEEGLECFNSMQRDYGIEPGTEHYLCIVDLLGRAGHFDSAVKIIQKMPIETRSQAWAPLLSAWRTHSGMQLEDSLPGDVGINLEPRDTGNYVLIANIHASLGNWKEATGIRRLMDKRGLIKEAGWSCIEPHSRNRRSFRLSNLGDKCEFMSK